MFKQTVDERLSAWIGLRSRVNESPNPLNEVWEFWKHAPFVPYNAKINPHYEKTWPTPWQIIVDNYYDDFTKALMIGWTLKLTNRYENDKIEIKTLVDLTKSRQYNIVCVDELWIINYNDNGPELAQNLPDSFLLENLIELKRPR